MRIQVEILLELLDRTYSGSRWHSLRSALKGLSAAEAAWTPPQHCGFPFMDGSIRDIVFHVGGDQLYQVSRRFGDGTVTWESLTARFEREGRTLRAALQFLEEGHAAVRGKLMDMNDNQLAERTTLEGRAMTNADFFAMMIEHNAYHAGQIRYVRNLIEGRD